MQCKLRVTQQVILHQTSHQSKSFVFLSSLHGLNVFIEVY